jgi:hypothetical protein
VKKSRLRLSKTRTSQYNAAVYGLRTTHPF